MKFNDIVENLKNKGFIVEVNEEEGLYNFATVTGKGIFAGFCTAHDENNLNSSYHCINGKISADNSRCFDKWSKCPVSLPMPKNKEEMTFLFDKLEHLGTDEGYEKSNSYNYEHVTSYIANIG
ncbi:hypothetical protein [Bacillus pumilus]|uniref:Uncharacterized protein n=1 Tax=Bacillus pumilus TaxID=1408 RepID=A0AAD0MMS5_BACPU|nr:hypothetical protein [Bacillus pumilus]AVM24286.1 hypothetical protein C5695_10735 [Bacillus pumilus]TYS42802.1 hypothetical protein FZC68_10355 [Bacillus pumilus]